MKIKSEHSYLGEWGGEEKDQRVWVGMLAVFYFFSLIYFNWRIIALQCCVGFCHPSTWISHRYTYVPSLLDLPATFHTSRLSQSPRLSSLYYTATSHQLSVLHMVIYICQCYSLSLSHPLLPPLCNNLFFIWVSIPTLQIGSSVLFFLDSIYMH